METKLSQILLNYAFAALFAIISWNVTELINRIDTLNKVNMQQTEEINNLKVFLNGSYLTREEYERKHEQLIFKLDTLQTVLYGHDAPYKVKSSK